MINSDLFNMFFLLFSRRMFDTLEMSFLICFAYVRDSEREKKSVNFTPVVATTNQFSIYHEVKMNCIVSIRWRKWVHSLSTISNKICIHLSIQSKSQQREVNVYINSFSHLNQTIKKKKQKRVTTHRNRYRNIFNAANSKEWKKRINRK